jgi:hypothetical protein
MFIFLPSCGEDTKTNAKKVNKLEILAIKVDKPQAHAGENIIAESLVGYPELYNNEFHTIWFLCNPTGGTGIQSCMSEEGVIGLPAIDNDKFNFTVPTDILSSQNLESKKLYAIFIICEADIDKCQSSLMSENSNQFDSDIFKISYKTVEIIKDDSPIVNHNPKIKSIYLNGTELTSSNIALKASNKDNRDDNIFKAEVTSDSFDEIKTPKGEKDYETIAFAWKSTLGDITYYYTDQKYNETIDDLDENPFQTASNTENETYHLYIIAIDSRGGIDWKILNITNEK